MKALGVFPGQKKVEIVDHPEPGIERPDQVKIRMLDVGICGTDKEIVGFSLGTPPPGSDYLILGHESLGEVVETGSGVEDLKTGDLVVTSVRRPCPHDSCAACRQGRSDFCYTGDYTERGIKDLHGFMAEYIVDEERYLSRLPASLRDVGVLIEPLTIAEKALIQVRDVQARLPWGCGTAAHKKKDHSCRRALVLGAGPVGLLGAMLFKAAGFETIVYSRSSSSLNKPDLVASFGINYISAEEVPVEEMLEQVGDLDFVYEAVGGAPFAFDVLNQLGANGIFIFTGVPGRKAPLPLDVHTILQNLVSKNLVVMGTVNAGPDAFSAAVRDLEQFVKLWPEATRELITRRVPLEEAPELLSGKISGVKNVVSPNA